jgi:hypothetical protein
MMMAQSFFSSKALFSTFAIDKNMKKKRRNAIKLLGLAVAPLLLMALGLVFCRQKSGFQVAKIRPSYDFSMYVESFHSSEEMQDLKRILSQEFHYLGNGAQCYVFVSEDQEYVLKFFKMKHLTPKYWLNAIPLPWLDKYRFEKIDSRERKQYELFNSFKIAFEEFRHHTGITFVHLAKTKHLLNKISVLDKTGHRHYVSLDAVPFVLQKKAVIIYSHVRNLIQAGKEDEALSALRSVLDLIQQRCSLGLGDKDGGVGGNYGFIDNKPVHIDVGRIARDESLKEPLNTLREIIRVSKKMEVWLQKECPRLVPRFQEQVLDILDSYEGMGSF